MATGLGGRYAAALFELARDERRIDAVGQGLDRLDAALAESAELREVTTSPLIGRDAATAATLAVVDQLGLDPLVRNMVGVLGRNRRLAQLRAVIRAYRAMAAAHRGETTAQVTAAHPLTDEQVAALRAKLRQGLGRDVAVDLTVDPSILGGLIVKVGSKQIDSSIKTKLESLAQAMKG